MNGRFGVIGAGWALALRSIRVQITQHYLGYAWTLVTPMIYAVCFLLIKQALNAGEGHSWPQAFRAFTGMMMLQLWFQVLKDMAGVIRQQKGVLRGLNVGAEPFILGLLFEGALSLLLRLAIILVAWAALGLPFPSGAQGWLWLALAGASVLLSAAALGLLLAPWASLYGDVRKALSNLNMPVALISPIFYPAVADTASPLYTVNLINPLASPLAVIADLQTGGPSLYATPLVVWSALSLALIVWGARLIRRQVPVLLERLG